jgi:hypothetical protein
MRGFWSWCGAVTIGFGGGWLAFSIAFNVLDEFGVYETTANDPCHEILCDINWFTVAMTVAAGLTFSAWLTGRARRWIESRFTRPAP